MGKVHEIIEIKEYFKEMKMIGDKYSIKIELPEKWVPINHDGIGIGKLKKQAAGEKVVYVVYIKPDVELTLSDLIGYVLDIEKYNLELMDKTEILKDKIKELKEIILKNDIETLKTLEIRVGRKKGRPSKRTDNVKVEEK